jgi:hypothetical protein
MVSDDDKAKGIFGEIVGIFLYTENTLKYGWLKTVIYKRYILVYLLWATYM